MVESLTLVIALFVILIFALLRRPILSWLVSTNMYKMYYASLQYQWSLLRGPPSSTRRNLLAELREVLAENGGDVLEIGSAAGRNIAYMNLPEGSSYIALDYNPAMESYLRENLKKFPNNNIPLKQFIAEDAGDMRSIQDGSLTAVLGAQILCSLEEEKVKQVLQEVKRVLKPGGYYFFLEHVIDKPGTLRRVLAILSSALGMPVLFDGCRCDKETWKDIERAGFRKVMYRKGLEPRFFSWSYPVLTMLRYLTRVKIHGYAVKSSGKDNTLVSTEK